MLFTILFCILMIAVFGKILLFAIKATWAVLKVVGILVILPVALVALVCFGLIYVALPILAVIGVVVLIKALCDKKATA